MSRGRQELAPARRSSVGGFEVSSVWFTHRSLEVCETALRTAEGVWFVMVSGSEGFDAHDAVVADVEAAVASGGFVVDEEGRRVQLG